MMLVSSAVFSAVLAGLEALLEDEDEDEDEQRNRVKMLAFGKDWRWEKKPIQELSYHTERRDELHELLKSQFRDVRRGFQLVSESSEMSLFLKSMLSKIDGPCVKHVYDVHSIIKHLSDDSAHEGTLQLHEVKDAVCYVSQSRTTVGPSFGARIRRRLCTFKKRQRVVTNGSSECESPFYITPRHLVAPPTPRHRPRGRHVQLHRHRPRAPSIQRLPRRPRAPPVWIYDTGASFSLTENLSLLQRRILPPHHHRRRQVHRLHRPRAPSIQRLPRPHPPLHAHWIYDTGASFSLTENLSLLHHRILPAHRGILPPLHAGILHAHWIYDTGASFSLTENLSLRQPPARLHHQPPPHSIYDTGASFSLTGDLSLLPGVCSTGDCSSFLGLRHADPVSAANGQSVVSNKCGRASGTLNLSRTAPQTTWLISSSEPIAADNSSLLTPDTTPEQTWRVASAAPQHMTGYLNHLIDYTPSSGDQVIDTPNMGRMAVHGRGSVNTANITLQDVLYVPCLDANLVSTGQLAQLGYMITLGPYGCRIYKDDEDMPLVGEAHYVDGYLLELDFLRVRPSTN